MAKKTETRPSTATINPFGLRMQPELREQLEAAASESGRSLNAEITARLEASFASNDAEDFHRDFLNSVVFDTFEEEEDRDLRKIDRDSVDGMLEWLERVDAWTEKRKRLEAMADQALRIHEARKAAKAEPTPPTRKQKR
ncbi:Arc family DNA-binding protein [Xanthomonas sp. WHRI 7945]|nr:Arc family DNA-binding protein [Xanthomonas campestris pv. campestris]